jgi:peptide/nickel transport system substrate-binding protein
MMRRIRRLAATAGVVAALLAGGEATAEQRGGVLKVYLSLTPASASVHEEASIATVMPFMGVFNNLFVYNQHAQRNDVSDLTPELATEWRWSDDNRRLTLRLREGVTWHDGKPFTSADVKCTWDTVAGRRNAGWRKNPRREWYSNLQEVETNGEHEVTFVLGRPQPSFMAFLASGFSPVYPCHVDSRVMRQKPIGTGPFRVVDFRPNTGIELERNPTYWRPNRPLLDGISFRAVRSRATRHLAFISGEFDMTFTGDVSPALLRDVQGQAPNATCDMRFTNVTGQILMNREVAPFDNPNVRRAVALAVDRDAFLQILGEGHFVTGGAMLAPPAGLWGVSGKDLAEAGVDGFTGTVAQRRAEAQRLMREAGFGPQNPLRTKLITRDSPSYRDPAVILIDHLKSVFIEAELQVLETSVWYNTLVRNTWGIAQNQSGTAIDDPDVFFYENYLCGSDRNYSRYCNRELQTRFDEQSAMTDMEARRRLVREIDIQLQRELARPIIFQSAGATCRHPHVRGITQATNSQYNHWRMEDAWLAPR